ncbi:MAG: YaiI/YqxD family protein [bacterium]|nr:YaiI/YqxD family protein [bacterium]
MHIWIDADACPNTIKEILFRAAIRREIGMTLVANNALTVPASKYIKTIKVGQGLDVADREIVKLLKSGDLVITADIPLAADVIEKGGHALNPRGEFYSEENIRERLSMRNFMDELRSGGMETGGPPSLGPKDKQAFANQLDRFLTSFERDKTK